jgi:coenzyme F420-0:L-glutamate ligase/coenzyme F420-1:gamma-L-glutamate ligase
VTGVPEIKAGDDLVKLLAHALAASAGGAVERDIVVVASKIVSKAEARRATHNPAPSETADGLAQVTGFDPGEVELILAESKAVLRTAPGVLVVETRHGFVCANAGVDRSNTGEAGTALLLPEDSDASAEGLRQGLSARFGVELAVLVSDTFGRPFRHGLVNVALGVAGMGAIRDYRGQLDSEGRILKGTEMAIADELCSAAELVMNKLERVPAAVIRGYAYEPAAGSGRVLMRDPALDYFR